MVDPPRPDDPEPERRQQLQALGEMLLGIAHELNTPLAALGSMLGTLEQDQRRLQAVADRPDLGPGDHAELREILARMQQSWPVLGAAHGRLDGLVRQLRLAGRPERDRPPEPVDLVAVIEGDLLLLQFAIKQGIVVERRFHDRPTVRGHASLLGQVFLNLLRNAIQALDGSGTITVSVRQRGDRAEVVVADDGPGIAPDLRDRLFCQPCSSKDPEVGTGLGLTISHRIVTAHGGTIAAASPPGGGAVFTVTLPLA